MLFTYLLQKRTVYQVPLKSSHIQAGPTCHLDDRCPVGQVLPLLVARLEEGEVELLERICSLAAGCLSGSEGQQAPARVVFGLLPELPASPFFVIDLL